jgi:hypothetical protein
MRTTSRISTNDHSFVSAVYGIVFLAIVSALPASAQTVVANAPYTVSVFATSVPGVYTAPDSITLGQGSVFVGYGNGVATDGSDGKSSTIVQYSMSGAVLNTFSVKGHNDGLKWNPKTNLLWSLQNEDGNPNLVTIDPKTAVQKVYTIAPPAAGGGIDDVAFLGNNVYLSSSAPANNPNLAPAIVQATLNGTSVTLTPVLLGNSNATDITTGNQVTLNLQDPDSMIVDPNGDLVLDSQSDAEIIVVHRPGFTDQSVFHLAISSGGAATQIDDTVFATSSKGVILVSDRNGETVYAIQAPFFPPSAAYSSAPTFVGLLDMSTGNLTPVVTGMVSPHGMLFIKK